MQNKYQHIAFGGALALGVTAVAGAYSLLVRHSRTSFYRNKSVLISGGSRGLGLALARELAMEGAKVTIVARDAQALERARRSLLGITTEVHAIDCDVRSKAECEKAVMSAVTRFGFLDVVIHNAGIIQVGPFDNMRDVDFKDSLATHFWAGHYLTQAALSHLAERDAPRIVYISSIGGKIGVPHLAPYCAGKFALTGYSEALRAELASKNIKVTLVCPGLMRTGSPRNAFFKGQYREEYAWFSVASSLPFITIDARRAALKILRSAERGRSEIAITPQARLAIAANAIAPAIVATVSKWVNRMLPKPSLDERAFSNHLGKESTSSISPSFLTRMSEKAALQYNEN